MGERKGQNKYYPPDFDYKKHKSLAGYHGQHPLRERARKLHMGILIIRFEMPYNIWCDGCNKHVAMGVRYNAEKSKIGMYYTTPIYKFRMKCHLCDNHFEIKTDPANHDYVIISGARRKEQRWDPHENEQIVPEDRATQKKLALDAMYKLEHGVNDLSKSKGAAPTISQIVARQSSHKDDFLLNQLARKRFREVKKTAKDAMLQDEEFKKKFSLDIDLVPESKDDVRLAELLQYSTVESYDDRQRAKRKAIEQRPLFANDDTLKSPALELLSPASSVTPPSSAKKKLVTLSHMKQIYDKTRACRLEATFGNKTVTRVKKQAFSGVASAAAVKKRKYADNVDSACESDRKRLKMSTNESESATQNRDNTAGNTDVDNLNEFRRTSDCLSSRVDERDHNCLDGVVSGSKQRVLVNDNNGDLHDSDALTVSSSLSNCNAVVVEMAPKESKVVTSLVFNYDSSAASSDSE